jgi:transposase
MLYVGLDLHKRFCYGTVLDEKGEVVNQAKFDNEEEGYDAFFKDLPSKKTKVVIEATSGWVRTYEILEAKGYDVQMAHPLKTRAIAEARIKTDKIDSAVLAHLLRTNMVVRSYIPCKEIRVIRDVVRHRVSLGRLRASLKNRVYAILNQAGIRHSFADLFCKKGISFLLSIDAKENLAIRHHIDLIQEVNKRIEENRCTDRKNSC